MKVQDVLEMVAETRPHVYSDEVLCRWLSDIEGKIHHEIFEKEEPFQPITPVDDSDRELLAYEPYTNVYVLYLYAMIEFANCETVKYMNASAMFNAEYSGLEADWRRNHPSGSSAKWKHLWR